MNPVTNPRDGVEAAAQPPDWYWEQDAQHRLTSVRAGPVPRAGEPAHRVGRARWQIPGALPLNASWPEHRARLDAHEAFSDFRYAVLHDGGAPRYLSESGAPCFDSDGTFAGYRGFTMDITSEWESDASEDDLLNAAARIGRLGAWSIDARSGKVTWSQEVRRIHELPDDARCSLQEGLDFYIPEHRPIAAAAVARCLATGAPFDFELQIVTARGRLAWIRAVGEAERDSRGRIVRIRGAVQDVTRTREAAGVQRTLAKTLQSTLDCLTDGFLILDSEWRFVYVNDEACRIAKRPREALLGRSVWTEFPGLVGTRLYDAYHRAIAEGRAVAIEDFYAPYGLWFRLKASPSPGGLSVSIADITAEKDAQLALTRLNTDLEADVQQRIREMEALAYAIAHDLRAPLAVIDGYSRVLLTPEAGELAPRGRHYAERIVATASRMEEMIDGLLGLARLSTAALERRPTDLGRIAQEVVAALRARDPGRAVEVEIAPDLSAHCDPVHATHLLDNLLGNAWKFTAQTPGARIEFGVEHTAEGAARYFIRDNGVGFDPAYAGKLFKPFQRLHGANEFKGTGIGLALVHKIVSLHGGDIVAQSQPGAGACFRFTLEPAAAP